MTTDVIKANKEEFLNRCRKYIHREGIDKLLDYLENKQIFSRHHPQPPSI